VGDVAAGLAQVHERVVQQVGQARNPDIDQRGSCFTHRGDALLNYSCNVRIVTGRCGAQLAEHTDPGSLEGLGRQRLLRCATV
jgi:hypothetical protein